MKARGIAARELRVKVADAIKKELCIITNTVRDLDEDIILDAVHAIVTARNDNCNVFVSGMGKCSFVAEKTAATFCSQGIPSFYLNCAHAQHGDIGALRRENDIVILFSKSGDTEEVLELAKICKGIGLLVIGITCDGGKLRYDSDICIVLPIESESDHLNLAATASITVMTMISNLLGSLASEALGFTKSEFHARHNKGKLGELSK